MAKSKISILKLNTYLLVLKLNTYLLGEIHIKENFLIEICTCTSNKKCLQLFSNQKLLGHLVQILNAIVLVFFMSVAMQNHHRLFIFCCVLKPEAVVRAFQNKKIWNFFIYVDEPSLGTKVFMITEILNTKVVEAETWDRI